METNAVEVYLKGHEQTLSINLDEKNIAEPQLLKDSGFRFLKADRVIDTLEDFINDETVANVTKGFQCRPPWAKFQSQNWQEPRFTFLKAYIKGEDVYTIYRFKLEGLIFVMKESVSSMLSSSPFHTYILYKNGMMMLPMVYQKTRNTREKFANTGVVLGEHLDAL